MRQFIKVILRTWRLSPVVRNMRKKGYTILDLFGGIYFSLLRRIGIAPEIKEFNRHQVRKILIIRIDRIGDLILSTPAIRAVRKRFPEAAINLIVSDYTKDLVIDNQYVDKILIYEKVDMDQDYDLAIALHPGMVPNRLTYESAAQWRVGYTGQGGGFYLTHNAGDDRDKRVRHEVESALELVEMVDCRTADRGLDISVTEHGDHFAEAFFEKNNVNDGNPTVAIHPGSRQEYLRWKKEGFSEVGDALMNCGANVLLIGGRNEKLLLETVAESMKKPPLQVTDITLTQLISLLNRCDLFIGHSTGPMHIASALDIPVVAIFGPVHPLDSYQEWGPLGGKSRVVTRNMDCPDCHPSDCRTYDCINLITASDVLKAVKSLMGDPIKICHHGEEKEHVSV